MVMKSIEVHISLTGAPFFGGAPFCGLVFLETLALFHSFSMKVGPLSLSIYRGCKI